jgi:hypothetical protein
MDRKAVDSSNIASVGYDNETEVLEVEFHHGGVYQYADVPQTLYAAMMASRSVGHYFATQIKDHFSYGKVA